GNGPGPKIDLWEFTDKPERSAEEQEAEMVAREIGVRRWHEQLKWSDFAVLYRTNLQAKPIEETLRAANIPYRVIGGQSYFDRFEVANLVAYLQTITNPADENSLRRIINYPTRGIGRTTLMKLVDASREARRPMWETMRQVDEVEGVSRAQREPVKHFVEAIEELQLEYRATEAAIAAGQVGERTLMSFAREVVRRFRLEEAVRADNVKSERATEVRLDILREFVASIGTYEERTWTAQPLPDEEDDWNPPALREFLERISLSEEDDRKDKEDDEPDRVTLMSMHAAKGLEFTHVFIIGLEEDILPHSRSVQAVADENGIDPIAEERRLFYVGITRARHRLTLSGCATRRQRGDVIPRQPSRFLKEIPVELLEHRSGQSRTSLAPEEAKEMKENFFARMKEMLGQQ
ncbi:MAG TPA: ATP-dependent helicase, partial [Longimicrobium sp.]